MGTQVEVRASFEVARKRGLAIKIPVISPRSLASRATRVFAGAALSTVDLATDVYITYTFWSDGKESFFRLSIAMLSVSMSLGIFFVSLQNQKVGFKKVFAEVLLLIFGLKAGADAFRVVSGAKMQEGQVIEPLMELTLMRALEMFAEAIPGVIIQLSAILSSDGKLSIAAIVSLIASALTTGFGSASLSYDLDTDTRKRFDNPDFYGYIPMDSRRRTVLFFSMLLISAVMLFVRALVFVLLGLVQVKIALLFFWADIALFIFFKIVRGDFIYWIAIDGVTAFFVSFVVSLIAIASVEPPFWSQSLC